MNFFDSVKNMLFGGKCYSKARLVGKTAVITGCNTGIGKETVLDFYKRGAHVVMACRDTKKAEAAMEDVQNSCKGLEGLGTIVITKLDLNSLVSVRECAQYILKTEPKINLLINNAGVMTCPAGKTEDGFETQFGTNHLAHFLFTLLLLPKIINSKPARIVNVSSKAHYRGTMDFDDINYEKKQYSAMGAYHQSKLANVLFTKELARKLQEKNIKGVNVYSLHPGVVTTELARHMDNVYFSGFTWILGWFSFFMKSPELGAQTTVYCAVDEKCANETGLYYSDCAAITPSADALDPNNAQKLWDISCKMVGLNNYDPFTTSQ